MTPAKPDGVETDDAAPDVVMAKIVRCAMSWEADVRILGNVRAGDIARAAQHYDEVVRERDRLQALNKEMVEALEKAEAAVWDSYYGHGLTVGYAQKVSAEIKIALSKADTLTGEG